MKINSISGINSRESFASRIVFDVSANKKELSSQERNFLERFDDLPEDQRENITRVIKEDNRFITYYSPSLNCTIKEQKPIPEVELKGPGTLESEFALLQSDINRTMKNTPQALAYAETITGGKYLLSKPVNEILLLKPIKELEPKTMESILKQLYQADKNGIQLLNLQNNNILTAINKKAFFMDFQDATRVNRDVFFASYVEARNNMNIFEGQFLAPYLDRLTPDEARKTLKTYLQLKSKYCEKSAHDLKKAARKDKDIIPLKQAEFEKAKAYVYKNPTDEVLDLELLKMHMYNFDFRRASYFDSTNANHRNILEAVKYAIWSDVMACALYGYEPKKMPKKAEAIEYFTCMNTLGDYWQRKKQGCSKEVEQIKEIFKCQADSTNLVFPKELQIPADSELPCNEMLVTIRPDSRSGIIRDFSRKLLDVYKENNPGNS